MAWKLKKWKGAEAEEDQPSEEGVYDISGAAPPVDYKPPQAPPAYVVPEPSQAFNASAFTETASAPPPAADATAQAPDSEPDPLVIAMGPADMEGSVAPAPSAPLHDLEEERTLVQPTEFAAPSAPQDLGEHDPDYYAQSVAHADEAVAAFQEAAATKAVGEQPAPGAVEQQPPEIHTFEPDEEPIAFEIDPSDQAVANLHERPIFSDPDDVLAAEQSFPGASAPARADTLGAFAPYQPAPSIPSPDPAFAIDEPASEALAPPSQGVGSAPPLSSGAPAFEDDLSFAPSFSSRLIVKIGPFSATYEIDKPEYSIGRPDPKTGNSPDIGLEWDDAVSRHHARILHRADGDYLEDVGSSNGTLLNGQLIAVNTPILLKNGDVITIGERTQISYLR